MRKKTIPFNVLLDYQDYDRLEKVAEQLQYSKGQVFRIALNNFYQMKCANVPTCANGQPCFVPHLHRQSVDAQLQLDL